MGVYRQALEALAALSVAGVTNYGIDATPQPLTRAHLPALLVLPDEQGGERLFSERGAGLTAGAFDGGARALGVRVTHLLLLAPAATGIGARAHIPALTDLIDATVSALSADLTLGGVLARPLAVSIEPGAYERDGVRYHGCAFRHTWALEVSPP